MRGGYPLASKKELILIQDIIENLGFQLTTKHQTEKEVFEKENKMTPKEIYQRDLNWIKESDFCIFEISNPSLGVGAEISDALNLGKPVLCLSKKNLKGNVSAYIKGKASCFGYGNLEEIKEKIILFTNPHTKPNFAITSP